MFRSLYIASAFSRRFCSSFTVKEVLLKKPVDQKILVQGWVQAVRKYKELFFVDLIDGTCLDRLQIVINAHNVKPPNYGSSLKVQGSVVESSHAGQEIELIADSWETLGTCDENYPFENHKKYSSEYIRQYPHLRPRTRRFSSILRIRNHASMAVHNFFQNEGFCFIHTPIITQNDCEGAGEVFTVEVKGKLADTLLTKNVETNADSTKVDQPTNNENEHTGSNVDGDILEKHFFGAPTFLTVSGQLHLESIACALTRVYNFGPTFRAEASRTRMHASEFQMIEAEIAFIENVDELLKTVEKCLKKVTESIMENCPEEVKFIVKDVKNYEHYIKNFSSKSFVRMPYKEAISILQKNKESLKTPIEFGEDLATEHKQFIVNYCDNVPVFVSMFPSTIKPFYMKSDENNMACCFDLFAAYGGEICGGSLREDNEENLKKKYSFEKHTNLSWYLDLRKYGTVPHGGFGIGFERLLQSILGISNIRDIIPFPRRKYDCKC
ncbi:probable asparagine--tRNA ligase, mitochondrial [Argiope bruennichi]|uniref:asparagine--tRNA ligase n=1 Tax=Argiope bruennichi TaxID=94029 RepID=A0A8T0FZ30_ARGBR|nr:probable asparagine--tRNA ligase, mitochondrial [Argiope bruennichi]KAF8796364.1 putative asparagine--tRNA ligase like protein [Argiope bruennichi]